MGISISSSIPDPAALSDPMERDSLAKALRYMDLQPGAPIPLVPPGMSLVLAAMEMADSNIDMAETAAVYGIEPTSVEGFARQFFGKQ